MKFAHSTEAFRLRASGVNLSKKSSEEIISHELIPQHVVLSAEQKAKVLEKYKVSENHFPKILLHDPALRGLNAKVGDLVQIRRKDFTGEYYYYRIVVNE
jgi:DNA-directed RNA polymerase subunit H